MGESGAILSNGILLFLLVLFLSILGGYFLRQHQCKILHQAGLATILGIVFGALLQFMDQGFVLQPVTQLNVQFFLLFLLPPIIFQSGYNIDTVIFIQKAFFNNFGGICLYAFSGTLMSAVVISSLLFLVSYMIDYGLTVLQAFAFGALISATDPVSVLAIMKDMKADKMLYNLVFGQSIFNDAVTISLYRAIIEISEADSSTAAIFSSIGRFIIIFGGSFLIGAFVALLVSFILKKTENLENRVNFEATAVIFGPWVSYLLTQALTLSGIVSILFCGVFMARYTSPNLSNTTRNLVGKAYAVIAHAAQTLVFIFLGMGLFSFNLPLKWLLFRNLSLTLLVAAVVLIQFGRAVNIVGNSWILSLFKVKIPSKFQFFMWFSGLRGAIGKIQTAFALAIQASNDFKEGNGQVILELTLIYAILTVLLIGGTITPLMNSLDMFDREEPGSSIVQDKMQLGSCKEVIASFEQKYLYPMFVKIEEEENQEILQEV